MRDDGTAHVWMLCVAITTVFSAVHWMWRGGRWCVHPSPMSRRVCLWVANNYRLLYSETVWMLGERVERVGAPKERKKYENVQTRCDTVQVVIYGNPPGYPGHKYPRILLITEPPQFNFCFLATSRARALHSTRLPSNNNQSSESLHSFPHASFS